MPPSKPLASLRRELLQIRNYRFRYQMAKIASIGPLASIAALVVEKLSSPLFFYIIPFVALLFDVLILGESFNLRRLSAFIRLQKKTATAAVEVEWEFFVKLNPNKFLSWANELLTLLASIGSLLIVLTLSGDPKAWFAKSHNAAWLVVLIAIHIAFYCADRQVHRYTWKGSPDQLVG